VKKIYKIRDLEQVRLLSDPLKLQLLQSFAESAKTTKQIAAELGESVTKLYRHVDALHDSGLLTVVEEKQKRGTIERTFRAVAHRFEADHTLFNHEAGEAGADAAREMLRIVETEIVDVLTHASDKESEQPLLFRVKGKASPEQIAELRATLQDWLDTVQESEELGDEEARSFGGLVAFYQSD
jgi:predicted ArsR family transcriptional regulator